MAISAANAAKSFMDMRRLQLSVRRKLLVLHQV